MKLPPLFTPCEAYLSAVREIRENPGQRQVFDSRENCVVLAGPGSGKTKCLTVKIARMLHEDVRAPHGIATISFSTECVRHLRRKLGALGVQEGPNLYIGTVHSFCLKHIVIPFARLAGIEIALPVRVATPSEQGHHLAVAERAIFGNARTPPGFRGLVLRTRRSLIREEAMSEHVSAVIAAYQQSLRAAGLVDFDDMILLALNLVEKHSWVRRAITARFPILAVDEYQDLGIPLHRMVLSLLKTGAVRLLAVGDPDQSIYGFIGAQPQLLVDLAHMEGVERVQLHFNYRSGKTIVAASEAALGEERRYEARANPPGTVDMHSCPDGIEDQARRICETIIPEALVRRPDLCLGDIAILYADKTFGNAIASAADRAGVPYQRIDKGAPYERTPLTRWIEDCAVWCAGGWRHRNPPLRQVLRGWLSLLRSDISEEDVRRREIALIVALQPHLAGDVPLREFIRDLAVACLKEIFSAGEHPDERYALRKLWEATGPNGPLEDITVRGFAGQRGSPDHVNLITLHSAKGLEFEVVVIMGVDNGVMPSWREEDDMAEARRLFYVGLTRAKSEVHLAYSGFTTNGYGRRFDRGPSPFLEEVRKRLAESEAELSKFAVPSGG